MACRRRAGFSAGPGRYAPVDHTLTAVVAGAGPEARYDGALGIAKDAFVIRPPVPGDWR